MSDLPPPRHLAALVALSGASPGAPPNRQLRATDEVFWNLHLLNHYQGLTDDEASGTGAFQQVIEDLDRQREWLRAMGEPQRYQSLAFELGSRPEQFRIDREPAAERLRTSANISIPPEPSDPPPGVDRPLPPTKKSLPVALRPKLADALSSRPHLTRPQQYKEVAELPEFRDYQLTQSVLREAARTAPQRPGRPRKQPPDTAGGNSGEILLRRN
jgi:hypothetical protein